MAKQPYQRVAFSVAAAATGNQVSFTPQAGNITGICVYSNLSETVNTGLVRLKVMSSGGNEIAPLADLRHFRNRETAYNEGFVPLNMTSDNTTYIISIEADTAFADVLNGEVIFNYDLTGEHCY